jgi:hypothetical protein
MSQQAFQLPVVQQMKRELQLKVKQVFNLMIPFQLLSELESLRSSQIQLRMKKEIFNRFR